MRKEEERVEGKRRRVVWVWLWWCGGGAKAEFDQGVGRKKWEYNEEEGIWVIMQHFIMLIQVLVLDLSFFKFAYLICLFTYLEYFIWNFPKCFSLLKLCTLLFCE